MRELVPPMASNSLPVLCPKDEIVRLPNDVTVV